MFLNSKFTVDVYKGLTQTRDARGSLFFSNFEISRGNYWARVLEIFVSPALLPQHLLHNYVAGLRAFYADLLCVWYAQCSLSIFHFLSSDISYAASIVHNLYTTPFLDIPYVYFLYHTCTLYTFCITYSVLYVCILLFLGSYLSMCIT